MEILIALALAAIVAAGYSPNSKSLKATRGSAGAARGVKRYMSRPKGKKSKGGGSTAAGSPKSVREAAKQGYRDGVAKAANKRAQGKDFYTRSLKAAGFVGRRAAAMKEANEQLKDLAVYHYYVRPAMNGKIEQEEEEDDNEEQKPQQNDPVEQTETKDEGNKKMATRTDLTSVDQYIKEAEEMRTGAAELLEQQSEIKQWTGDIGERYTAVEWGSAGLDQANAKISDAGVDLEALIVALDEGINEAKRLKRVGEVADEVGAYGNVNALRSS